jgi:hypothetical protein
MLKAKAVKHFKKIKVSFFFKMLCALRTHPELSILYNMCLICKARNHLKNNIDEYGVRQFA